MSKEAPGTLPTRLLRDQWRVDRSWVAVTTPSGPRTEEGGIIASNSTATKGAPLSYKGPPLQIQAIQPDKEAKVQGHDSPREQAQPAGQREEG